MWLENFSGFDYLQLIVSKFHGDSDLPTIIALIFWVSAPDNSKQTCRYFWNSWWHVDYLVHPTCYWGLKFYPFNPIHYSGLGEVGVECTSPNKTYCVVSDLHEGQVTSFKALGLVANQSLAWDLTNTSKNWNLNNYKDFWELPKLNWGIQKTFNPDDSYWWNVF